MSKTIKQVSDELGVSKQAVWQRIRRNAELQAKVEQHSHTIGGTVYIDEQAEEAIRSVYSDKLSVEKILLIPLIKY